MLLVLMMVVRLLILVVRLIGRTVLRGFSGPTVQLIVLLFVDQVVMQIVADPMARLSLLVEDLVKCFDFTRVAVRVVVLLLFFAVALALSPLALPGEQVGLPFLLDLLDLLLRDLDLLGQFDLFFGLRLEEGLGLVSRLVWVSFGLVSICFQFGSFGFDLISICISVKQKHPPHQSVAFNSIHSHSFSYICVFSPTRCTGQTNRTLRFDS